MNLYRPVLHVDHVQYLKATSSIEFCDARQDLRDFEEVQATREDTEGKKDTVCVIRCALHVCLSSCFNCSSEEYRADMFLMGNIFVINVQ